MCYEVEGVAAVERQVGFGEHLLSCSYDCGVDFRIGG